MNIIIRRANMDDLKIVQTIEQTVFEATKKFDPDLDMNFTRSKVAVEYYKKVLTSPENCVFIAEADEIPAGYLVGGPFKDPYRTMSYGEIQGIGTVPEFRRIGVGSKLVEEFRKWSLTKGYKKIYVNTYFNDERAVNFYKKQGLFPNDLVLIGNVTN